MPIESHTLVSKTIGYYLNQFKKKLDKILETIWQEFKKINWEVKHRINATNRTKRIFY